MSEAFFIIPLILFSVIIHECAHGWVAEKCGDDTARLAGRITLNPIPHIDLVGTVILPLLIIMSGAKIWIAWAKPVPINPRRFRNYNSDIIKVSFAGCAANFLTAVFFAVIIALFGRIVDPSFLLVFQYGVYINVMLGLFNLIPIPPLDGSNILYPMLPREAQTFYDRITPYGFVIIIVLINLPFFRIIFGTIAYFIAGTLLRLAV